MIFFLPYRGIGCFQKLFSIVVDYFVQFILVVVESQVALERLDYILTLSVFEIVTCMVPFSSFLFMDDTHL